MIKFLFLGFYAAVAFGFWKVVDEAPVYQEHFPKFDQKLAISLSWPLALGILLARESVDWMETYDKKTKRIAL